MDFFSQNPDGSFSPATFGGGGSGGNVNLTGINGVAPAFTHPLPVELSDGTNPFGTAGNPLSVNVITGGGSNASVGSTGASAPASATEIGIVDGTGKLQNVSPTTPLPISVASLPLPTLAATSTKQSDGSQKSQVVDGGGNVIGSTGNALDVNIKSGITNPLPVTGTITAITNQVDENLKQVGGSNVSTAAAGIQKVGVVGSTGTALDGTTAGVLDENVKNWGGTAVSAPPATGVPAVGTEVAPVIKPLQRRSTDLLSTATILASAIFTSAWFDTQQTGASQAVLSCLIPSSGFAGSALRFDTTDDTTQVNFVTQSFTPQTNVYNSFWVPIQGRYWRVRFFNGATQQTSPIIAVTTQAFPKTLNPALGGNLNDGVLAVLANSIVTDGVNSGVFNTGNAGNLAAGAVAQYVATQNPVSGNSWVGRRTPTIFKPIAAVAVTLGTPVAIWTPTLGKKFRVMGYALSLSVAGSVILKDATTEILRTPLMPAGIGQPCPPWDWERDPFRGREQCTQRGRQRDGLGQRICFWNRRIKRKSL